MLGYPCFHVAKRLLVHWEVNLEKALRSITKRYIEDGVLKRDIAKRVESFCNNTSWTLWVRKDDFPTLCRQCGGLVWCNEPGQSVFEVELPHTGTLTVTADEERFEVSRGDRFGFEKIADALSKRVNGRMRQAGAIDGDFPLTGPPKKR